MEPSPRALQLLRRRGAILLGGPFGLAEARAWLDRHGVPVSAHVSRFLRDPLDHPRRPVIIIDHGALDFAEGLVAFMRKLADGAPARVPPCVVVSDALHRGLRALGWRDSTYRVAFARADNLDDDLATALDELLASEPDLDESDAPPALGASARSADARFDVEALRAAVTERLAWAAAVVERVGDALHIRGRVPELVEREARAELSWHDASGLLFEVRVQAPLPTHDAWLSAGVPPTGLRALLAVDALVGEPAFDAAHFVRANAAGLAEARAQVALLDDLVRVSALRWDRDALEARAGGLTRDDAPALVDAALALWRGLARARLGAAPG